MPKFDKPDSPNIIWGVNALGADLTKPSDSYIQTGWTQVKPPYEYENYSMNKLYQGFAYYNQLGIPEWDSDTEYQANKSYVQGSNNIIYKCIQTHAGKNPTTAGNELFWERFEGNRQATTSSRGTVGVATNAEAISGLSDSLALTPSNFNDNSLTQNGYQKLPGGLIIQWLTVTQSTQGQSFNWPIEFPTGVLGAFTTDGASSSETLTETGVGSLDKTSFVLYSRRISDGSPTAAVEVIVFALGY